MLIDAQPGAGTACDWDLLAGSLELGLSRPEGHDQLAASVVDQAYVPIPSRLDLGGSNEPLPPG